MVIIKCNQCIYIKICRPVSVLSSYNTTTLICVFDMTSPDSIQLLPPCCCVLLHCIFPHSIIWYTTDGPSDLCFKPLIQQAESSLKSNGLCHMTTNTAKCLWHHADFVHRNQLCSEQRHNSQDWHHERGWTWGETLVSNTPQTGRLHTRGMTCRFDNFISLLGQPERWQANLSVFNLDSWNSVNVLSEIAFHIYRESGSSCAESTMFLHLYWPL